MKDTVNDNFYYRHTTGEKYINEFYLEKEYLPFFNTNSLHLIGWGQAKYKPGCVTSFCHPYWSLQLIDAGQALVDNGQQKKNVSAGDFVLVRPGVTFTYTVPEDTILTKRAILISNGQIMSLLCNQGVLAEDDFFHLPEPWKIEEFYNDILKTICEKNDSSPVQTLSGLVYLLLLELIAQMGKNNVSVSDFDALTRSIRNNPKENYTLSLLAERMHTGERTLVRLFRKNLKCSPMEYVIRLRLEHAAQMLALDHSSMKNIASDCGFNSFSYFSRLFRRYYNMPPGEYRKKHIVNEAFCIRADEELKAKEKRKRRKKNQDKNL